MRMGMLVLQVMNLNWKNQIYSIMLLIITYRKMELNLEYMRLVIN